MVEEDDEQKEKSLKELIKEMNEKLDDVKKKKKDKRESFWIPWKGKVGRMKAKKGWATYMIIQENGNIKFEKHPIEEQTVVVDGTPRIATPEEVLYYKNKPFIIQPSWSVKPFSPTENLKETVNKEYSSHGYKLLLNRMQNEAIKPKRSMSWAVGLLIVAAVIAAGYFAFKGGLFK